MISLSARIRHASCGLALTLAVFPMLLAAQAVTGVGFRTISVHDPVSDSMMPGYVFYPSSKATGVTWRGPYELAATADAPEIVGAKPLVVISHGHGGSNLGHHDLAEYLASHGFVVATIEHPGDNFHNSKDDGHAPVMIGRPVQISTTITYLLHDARWKSLIDPHGIGVAGFSNGGYTTLLVVGAVPTFSRFVDYCNANVDDHGICGMAQQLKAEVAAHGQTVEQAMAAMQNQLHRWGPTADPRVRAAFTMAPLSVVFDKQGLASIDRPVFLYYAADDQVLRPAYNALHIAPLIPTLVATRVVPRAGHYVFLAPCSPQFARAIADLCTDPPGVDRVKVHQQINKDALTFFRKTLE